MRPVKALFAVAALAALWRAAAWPGDAHAAAAAEENEVAVTGQYRNVDYAYSVQIPTGLIASRMKAPAPNHGVAMHAPGNDADILWVDGSFDAAGYGSAEAFARWMADDLTAKDGLSLSTIARTALSGLDARDVTLRRQTHGPASQARYAHFIVAFRSLGDDNTPIIYAIAVVASSPDAAVVKGFREVVESFRALPLPKRNQ